MQTDGWYWPSASVAASKSSFPWWLASFHIREHRSIHIRWARPSSSFTTRRNYFFHQIDWSLSGLCLSFSSPISINTTFIWIIWYHLSTVTRFWYQLLHFNSTCWGRKTEKRERKTSQINQDNVDWPQAYLYEACKLHYERRKIKQIQKKLTTQPLYKDLSTRSFKILTKALWNLSWSLSAWPRCHQLPNTINGSIIRTI